MSANPIAATLEKLCVGQRSGVSPLFGSLRSQNQSNVRRSRVSRNAVWRVVSADGGIGPLIPVIDVAVVHADPVRRSASATESRLATSRVMYMGFLYDGEKSFSELRLCSRTLLRNLAKNKPALAALFRNQRRFFFS